MSEAKPESPEDGHRSQELLRAAKRFCVKIAAVHYARKFCGTSPFFESFATEIDEYTNGPASDLSATDPEIFFSSIPDFETLLVAELERLAAEIATPGDGPDFPAAPDPGSTVEQIQGYAESTVRAVSDYNTAILKRTHDVELIGKILGAFAVARARESDAPWSSIGPALNMSAQAAHKKFASEAADDLLEQLEATLGSK